jgi:hypothetical protein
MMIGVSEAREQVPPVEHRCDEACHHTAALEVAGRLMLTLEPGRNENR